MYCDLCPQNNVSRVLKSYIIKLFTCYKHIYDQSKNYKANQCHKKTVKTVKMFTENIPINILIVSLTLKNNIRNKKIISSIITWFLFCGIHDLQLRKINPNKGKLFQFLYT